MCGMTGILSAGAPETKDQAPLVRRMTERLAHRGPDANGVWTEGTVVLGHRRYSILDLPEAGAQPMHSVCGRYLIVFNGEIYNHLAMRRDLDDDGSAPDWRGHSDTETLLACVAYWGLDETLKRGKGMFSLALWDRAEKRLSLARDRMGEKVALLGMARASTLCKLDQAAMRVSLETRVPFLDPDVIALSTRLPTDIKTRGGRGKRSPRQVLSKHVQRELIKRPKTGSGIPVGDWLRGPLRGWAENLSGSRDWTHRLWIILMLMALRARVA